MANVNIAFILFFQFILCCLCFPDLAHGGEYDSLFKKYSQQYKVPLALIRAIASQESALNPLCVNVAGVDHWPETRKAAEEIIRKAQAENKSYDVGLMQINSQWIKQWRLDPAGLLDAESNIACGTRILKDEIERNGLSWRAVARYHSPDPARGFQYAISIARRLRGFPELRSMLANPRLNGAYRQKLKKFRDFKLRRQAAEKRVLKEKAMKSPGN